MADVTPPVALAAYAGSGIAGANPMKTGVNAAKLAIAAFIVPYIFVLAPELLMINATAITVVVSMVTPAPSKAQVDAITFTPEYRKQIAKSWGIWDVIGTLGVVACCAAFYWYFF